MKKLYLLMLGAASSFCANSQSIVVDLEDLNLPADTFWNGSDLSGQFISNTGVFTNAYDTAWGGFWSGFSYSTMRDDSTAGFQNQYSSISGSGYNSSSTYGVYYNNAMELISIPNYGRFTGFWINNSTYAYLSMKNGDMFSKKFGDSTNASGTVDGTNGNDFLKLTVFGTNSDSVEFYLADYRGSSATDYIVDDWIYVDLTSLHPNSKTLKFKLSSSDNNSFGMVTPAYFCLDNLAYSTTVSLTENTDENLSVFPNPTQNVVNVKFNQITHDATYKLLDIAGKELNSASFISDNFLKLDLSNEPNGVYFLVVSHGNEVITKRIIKQ